MPGRNAFHQRLTASLEQLASVHQRRMRRGVEAVSTTECILNGQRCLSFATNDYLGLTRHPKVLAAFAAVASAQAGAGASSLIAGRSPYHVRLEEALAEFEATESALLFPSGFAAGIGTLTSLIGPQDAVFCDRENHASLIDGCRASAGKFFVYNRTEPDRLSESIERRRCDYDVVFIVTDTVFSMDGTLADLPQLCDIADRFNATVIVDEAHGTGVFGATGRGVCELQQCAGPHCREDRNAKQRYRRPWRLCGGLINTVRMAVEYGTQSVFLDGSAACSVRGSDGGSAGDHGRTGATQRHSRQRSMFARQLLQEAELDVITAPPDSPIIAVLLHDDALAVRVSHQMAAAGFFIPAVRPPTVASGTCAAAHVPVLQIIQKTRSDPPCISFGMLFILSGADTGMHYSRAAATSCKR